MNSHQWELLRLRFEHAQTLPPGPRRRFAEEERDPELRRELICLITAMDASDDFLETPLLARYDASQPDDARVGHQIGAWRVLGQLGEGGMGRVYLVERADEVFCKRAALKLIRGSCSSRMVRQFQKERRILALLDHPAIARALDGGATEDGAPYLVMEYVDGETIDRFCNGMPARECIRLFLQVVEAIEVAHRNLVVHRDLKPSNILVTSEGQAKVLDFGIAKIIEDEKAFEVTRTELRAGTPTYSSPEQLLHEPVTRLSDVYSLGAVLYRLLTGQPPHDLRGKNPLEEVRAVTETVPALPSRYKAELAGDLDGIVLKALERKPKERYQSAAEFAEDLRRYLSGYPVKARHATALYRARKFVARHRVSLATTAAIVLALGTGAVVTVRAKQLAERRFDDVRRLAHAMMFDYDDQLIELPGATPLRESIASDTVRYLDSIYRDSRSDARLTREIARAYREVGEIQGYGRVSNLGKVTAAETSFQKSVELWGRVAAGPQDRLELATSLERLASVETESGRLADAGKLEVRFLGILNGLKPGDVPARELHEEKVAADLTVSRLAQSTGAGMRAIEFARHAVEESEQLPSRPLDARGIAMVRAQLAVCENDYGLADPKVIDNAVADAQAAVKLVEDAPACGRISCRETMAAVLVRASIVFNETGHLQQALPLLHASDLMEGLVREDPNNLRVLNMLKGALTVKCNVLEQQKDWTGGLQAANRQLEVVEKLAANDPSQRESTMFVARGEWTVGAVLMKLGRYAEARPHLDRAASISDRPVSDSVDWLIAQYQVHDLRARVAGHLGDTAGQRAELQAVLKAANTYVARAPGHPYAMMLQANAESGLGAALAGVSRGESCTLLGKSLDGYAGLRQVGSPMLGDWKDSFQAAQALWRQCGATETAGLFPGPR